MTTVICNDTDCEHNNGGECSKGTINIHTYDTTSCMDYEVQSTEEPNEKSEL